MLLIEKLSEMSPHTESPETTKPPEKRPRTAVMKCFDEILEEASAGFSSSSSSRSTVEQYLAEPNLHFHTGNAYAWWGNNKLRFPDLSDLALWYLSPLLLQYHQSIFFQQLVTYNNEKRN